MSTPLRTSTLLALTLCATACSENVEHSKLVNDGKTKASLLQKSFSKPLVTFPSESNLTFGMKDCEVYRADTAEGVAVDWQLIIKPDFSLLPQICDRESIRVEREYLLVTTGLISFGAGGCCSAIGKYRTRDGIAWERFSGEVWKPMKAVPIARQPEK